MILKTKIKKIDAIEGGSRRKRQGAKFKYVKPKYKKLIQDSLLKKLMTTLFLTYAMHKNYNLFNAFKWNWF